MKSVSLGVVAISIDLLRGDRGAGDFRFWPIASDIEARSNVGFQGNCGSGWRAFKSTLVTRFGLRLLGVV
jgi:hypothetical protein